VVQLEKYFDFSLLSLTSLLSAPEREVTSPSDFKVVGALDWSIYLTLLHTIRQSKMNERLHDMTPNKMLLDVSV
jgi:hypothetical protein